MADIEQGGRAEFPCAVVHRPSTGTKLGLSIGNDQGDIVITNLKAGGLFSPSTLQVGDKLIKINGALLAGYEVEEASDLLRQATGTLTVVTHHEGGATSVVETTVVRPDSRSPLGLTIRQTAEGMEVKSSGGLFTNAPVEAGDRIESVNQAACDTLTETEVVNMIRSSGNAVVFRTRAGDNVVSGLGFKPPAASVMSGGSHRTSGSASGRTQESLGSNMNPKDTMRALETDVNGPEEVGGPEPNTPVVVASPVTAEPVYSGASRSSERASHSHQSHSQDRYSGDKPSDSYDGSARTAKTKKSNTAAEDTSIFSVLSPKSSRGRCICWLSILAIVVIIAVVVPVVIILLGEDDPAPAPASTSSGDTGTVIAPDAAPVMPPVSREVPPPVESPVVAPVAPVAPPTMAPTADPTRSPTRAPVPAPVPVPVPVPVPAPVPVPIPAPVPVPTPVFTPGTTQSGVTETGGGVGWFCTDIDDEWGCVFPFSESASFPFETPDSFLLGICQENIMFSEPTPDNCDCVVFLGELSDENAPQCSSCAFLPTPSTTDREWEVSFDCSNLLTGPCVGRDANGACISTVEDEPEKPLYQGDDSWFCSENEDSPGQFTCLYDFSGPPFPFAEPDSFLGTVGADLSTGIEPTTTTLCLIGVYVNGGTASDDIEFCDSCSFLPDSNTFDGNWAVQFDCSNLLEGPCVGLDANQNCISGSGPFGTPVI